REMNGIQTEQKRHGRHFFGNLPLKKKIIVIIMLISGMTGVLTTSIHTLSDVRERRATLARQLGRITEVIGYNSTAALSFGDADAATEVLSALRSESSVEFSCLYNKEGEIFAQYKGTGMTFAVAPPAPSDTGTTLSGDRLLILRKIMLDKEDIGAIFMQATLKTVNKRALRQILLHGLIAFAALGAAFLLALRLEKTISRPITDLTAVAGAISETQDFSVRAEKHHFDEIGVLVDRFNEMVTEVEKREAQLRESNVRLEAAVEERTSALQGEIDERQNTEAELMQYAQKLEHSNQELQDFAYITSHDLQEPLRKIQAFGDRLKTKLGDALTDQTSDYLSRMQDAAKRMRTLITDLLEFSRVTTNAKPFEMTSLKGIVDDVLSDLEIAISKSNARVQVGALPTLQADPLQMRQLFQNLIGNALKYCAQDTPPEVVVSCAMPQSDTMVKFHKKAMESGGICEIRVKDNGIGFEQKHAGRIFGMFQRLHGRGEYQGSGVGLAICRKIVERHNGTITAESVPNEGSTFRVRLPIVQRSPDQPDGENKEGEKDE
ncbi:ATP-binding protein, partial [Planctomycetota bacterium]